jgi:Cdc6-like AAA superfamily ATPase
MELLKLNTFLNREEQIKLFKDTLKKFEENKKSLLINRGIYVYGSPGSGKSHFVNEILNELNYDIILYDAGDVRNKNVFELITSSNMGDTNILSMFSNKPKKIAIVMDEIDGMNNGDKGGITSLIKLIRPKKTKKQKLENMTYNPIICIGNYHLDKKIKELMKVSINIEIKTPTDNQMSSVISILMNKLSKKIQNNIVNYLKGDLRKLETIFMIYNKQKCILENNIIETLFTSTNYCDDVKVITKKLLTNEYNINDVNNLLNETDKTSIALLFHENIIDVISKNKNDKIIKIYQQILDNICYGDYMDRITFQKQIWILTDITFLLKTMQNNYILHNSNLNIDKNINEIRFTKVLTKYSNEYNTEIFIQKLCENLNLDKKDLFLFFIKLREKINNSNIHEYFDNIDKLEITRIYKYLDYVYNFNSEID